MDLIDFGSGHPKHSKFFEYFISQTENIKIKRYLSIGSYNPKKLIDKKVGYFQFRINEVLCSMDNGDFINIDLDTLRELNTEILFISQIRKDQKEQLYELNRNYGYRIYPFILIPRYHKTIYPIFAKYAKEYTYMLSKNKKYVAHMRYGLRHRWHRTPWVRFTNQHNTHFPREKLIGEPFFQRLCDCDWGVSLKGSGDDYKCMRETEFANFGIPMALNFEPYYPFKFEKNVHYKLLHKPEDLQDLIYSEYSELYKFSQASKKLGEKYFSPQGCLGLMKSLLNQKKYNIEF